MQNFRRNIGWSDHSIGIKNAKTIIRDLNVKTFEKHFILEEDQFKIEHKGKVYRDSLHSANPQEFKKIAEVFND